MTRTLSSNRELFFRHLGQTSPEPPAVEFSRAEGCFIYDASGREYIDLISGIAVSGIGHRHPKVLEAIRKQCDSHLHLMVYGEFIQSPQVMLAEKISELLGGNLPWSTYLVNSGSEATEGAMKLAKRYTGRKHIAAFKNAYHGSTQGALSLIGDESFRSAYRPLLPGIDHLEFNDLSSLEKINSGTAAVFTEPVQGEAGVIKGGREFMKALRKKCDETGALLVCDEIQTGFGRTGKWFAFQHYEIVPDIVLMAKGMGGGMPIGAFAAKKEVMDALSINPVLGHITTFGGHPVSCAAALATIEVIAEEKLAEQVPEKEKWFHEELAGEPGIKELRSAGLLMALETRPGAESSKLASWCMQNGLITDWFIFNDQSIRIAPPLTIDRETVRKSAAIIKKGINSVINR